MAHKRRQGRPRSDTKRRAILKAAYELLVEKGMAELTIEAIATRSKVAKATIYRWWPSKGLLAIEGFLSATRPKISYPHSASAIADIKGQFMRTVRLYRGKTGKIMAGLIAQGHSDPETTDALVTGFILPRREELRKIFARGVKSGDLRADLNVEAAIDAIFGPLYYRLMINRGPFDNSWSKQVSDIALRGIMAKKRIGPRRSGPGKQ
jgi:AcrR family transcriptional regulator